MAITRARRQVVVFSSFDPEQLRAEETSSVGIKHLRAYLDLAAQGTDVLPRDARSASVRRPAPRGDRGGAARARPRRADRRRAVGVPGRPVGGSRPVDPDDPGAGGAARRARRGRGAARSATATGCRSRCSARCCAGRRSSGCGCRRGWPTPPPWSTAWSPRWTVPVAVPEPIVPDGGGRVVQGRGRAALGGDVGRGAVPCRSRRRQAGRAGRWTARRRSCRGSRRPPARSRCSTSCRRRRPPGRSRRCCTAGVKAEGPIHVDRLTKLTVGRVRADPVERGAPGGAAVDCCRRRPWSTTTCGPRASTRRRGPGSAGRSEHRPADRPRGAGGDRQRDGGAVPGVGAGMRREELLTQTRRCSATAAAPPRRSPAWRRR